MGGGAPARTVPGRGADRISAPQQTVIYVTMDPLDPKSGRYQTNVGDALVYFNERRGSRITDGSGGIAGRRT